MRGKRRRARVIPRARPVMTRPDPTDEPIDRIRPPSHDEGVSGDGTTCDDPAPVRPLI
jgi:hypothetical protein